MRIRQHGITELAPPADHTGIGAIEVRIVDVDILRQLTVVIQFEVDA